MHTSSPNLKSKLISKTKQTEKKTSFPLLQYRVGPLSSVFWNANTHLPEIFYVTISESQIYSKHHHCQANI